MAADLTGLTVPEYVEICPICKGEGEYLQRYIEGRFTGPCSCCGGARFLYRASGSPVGRSVRAQIETANAITLPRIYGGVHA